MPSAFEYAVVRVTPRVDREEFVNVGVILFCPDRDYLGVRIALDEQRLLALSPDVDLALVKTHLDAIERICSGGPDSGPIGELPLRERWRWLVSPKNTILQTSAPHAGLCDDPDASIERLVGRLVHWPPR